MVRLISKLLLAALCAIAPFVFIMMTMFAVNSTNGVYKEKTHQEYLSEPHYKDKCSWHCHNNGCDHGTIFEGTFIERYDLYNRTIRGLNIVGRNTGIGYGGASILVFCIIYPTIMYVLYLYLCKTIICWVL